MPKIFQYPKIPDPEPIGSYSQDDVVFLLKNIGKYIEEQSNEERQLKMQSGIHYSQMLPIEYEPTPEYLDLFYLSLKENLDRLALMVAIVSETILKFKGENIVLVSLARAGTPAGILIKRYLKEFYLFNIPHYSISIIRDRGIDKNALIYILQRHPQTKIQFIDGWTGKGAISLELIKSINSFQKEFGYIANLDSKLAVLADPGYCANFFGTCDDFLISNACLNSTVSGLVSRTVYKEELQGKFDFHGAKFYWELKDKDLSYYFINSVSQGFRKAYENYFNEGWQNFCGFRENISWAGKEEALNIQKKFNIKDINHIKPGVGETIRVLLRRIPWKILVKDINNPDIAQVLYLAKERAVEVEVYPELFYSCCGLIR